MEKSAYLGADDAAICGRIKQLRIDRGEKQEAVANSLNVARSTYAKLEGGRNKFSLDMIVRLANYFNVDCDFILRGHVSAHSEVCKETGLSGKAVEHLKVYGPLQSVLSSLIEEVEFSSFLACISRYINERKRDNPSFDDWGNSTLYAYRQELEAHGFVISTHSECARNWYENALEDLKKTLDKIAEREGVGE